LPNKVLNWQGKAEKEKEKGKNATFVTGEFWVQLQSIKMLLICYN
jgi:hypothetical protein